MEPILIVSSILLWLVVLFNLLLTVALIRRGAARQPGFDMENAPTLEIGSLAPDFTAETLEGRTVTLTDYAGKSLALIFISPTCKPCLEKLPSLNKISQRARSFGLELVLVNIASKDETKTLVQQQEIILPTFIAPPKRNSLMRDYKVAGTPFFCVVNEERKIASTGFLGPAWDEYTRSLFSDA